MSWLSFFFFSFFFPSTPLRTAVSWTSTQEGRRPGLKVISFSVRNNYATICFKMIKGRGPGDDVKAFKEAHLGQDYFPETISRSQYFQYTLVI